MNFLARAVRQYGESPLARDDTGNKASYADARKAIERIESELGAAKRLAFLLCENTTSCLLQYIGLLANGHTVLLLDKDVSEEALEEFTARYEPDVIYRCHDGKVEKTWSQPPVGGLHPDVSLLLSTSGSTGSPKVVRLSLDNLSANAASIAAYLSLDANERPIAHLPMHYSFGMSVINSHVVVGAALELTARSLMEKEFWSRIEEASVTSFSGVPFHYEILHRLRFFERREFPALRTLTQAGGRLSEKLVRRFARLCRERGWRFFVMYGQTEAGPRVSYLPFEDAIEYAHTIGRPIPGVELELVREDGTPIEGADEEGELVVISPSVMMGYAKTRADLARGDECAGRLRTGDIARRLPNGFYQVTGRLKRFIKLQGVRVNLDEVEKRMAAHGHDVICIGKDDRLWMVLEKEGNPEAVRETALALFNFPMRSLTIIRYERVPRSSSGKILYGELLRQLKSEA